MKRKIKLGPSLQAVLGSVATLSLLAGVIALVPASKSSLPERPIPTEIELERGSGRDELKQELNAVVEELKQIIAEQKQEEKPERKRRSQTEVAQYQTETKGPAKPKSDPKPRD